MFKKRLFAVVASLAILAAVTGSTGILADTLGFTVTAPAHACENSGSSGGGC